jgi:hypothetical protein
MPYNLNSFIKIYKSRNIVIIGSGKLRILREDIYFVRDEGRELYDTEGEMCEFLSK